MKIINNFKKQKTRSNKRDKLNQKPKLIIKEKCL